MPLLFGIDVEGVEPLVEDVHLSSKATSAGARNRSLAARGIPSGDFHEWFEIDNVPTRSGCESRSARSRSKRR